MKRKILWVVLGVVAFAFLVGGLAGYVAVAAGPDLFRARAALAGSAADLGDDEISSALDHLESARAGLTSVPARVLGLVPVARQNVGALRVLVERTIPVVEAARDLRAALDAANEAGLIANRQVDFEALDMLHEPLRRQTESLTDLEQEVRAHRSGWVLPPLWNALDDLAARTGNLRATAEKGLAATELAPVMLGAEGRRTYLVTLLNNAELRGAGGILSGAGTLTARRGRISLGEFDYYADLARATPRRRVESPPDFHRRFARYEADTTLWVNTTASPDIPDVAEVAGRLFEVSAGQTTDGAIIVDPRGLAALMPTDATVTLEETGQEMGRDDLARFVYSDAYERFQHETTQRRDSSLDLGPQVLSAALDRGVDLDHLERIGDAVVGGHLRVVSFDDAEQNVLRELGAADQVRRETADGIRVTVQNLGADKLDFWMRRAVSHRCAVVAGDTASCETSVRLRNRAPRDLPLYVVQRKTPYAIYRGYLEVYVPDHATVQAVAMDGEPVEVFREPHGGYESIGMNFSTPREQATVVDIAYEIPIDDSYALEMVPQPLARDGRAEVSVTTPEGWTVTGPGGERLDALRYQGPWDRALRFEAGPPAHTGIPRLWTRLARFWREPVF